MKPIVARVSIKTTRTSPPARHRERDRALRLPVRPANPYRYPSFGGSITTAGGITFIAASLDRSIRAFETRTGRLLWRGELPGDGLATPMSYATADGRQFVVLAANAKPGGMRTSASEGAPPTTAGGVVVAFALPGR